MKKTSSRRSGQTWYLYLLYSKSHDVYYVGITPEMRGRLKAHNEGKGAKFTRGRGPWRVEAVLPYEGRFAHAEAARQERLVKRMSRKKKLAYFS